MLLSNSGENGFQQLNWLLRTISKMKIKFVSIKKFVYDLIVLPYIILKRNDFFSIIPNMENIL